MKNVLKTYVLKNQKLKLKSYWSISKINFIETIYYTLKLCR